MNILDKIVQSKYKEVARLKQTTSISEIVDSPAFSRSRPSFRKHLRDGGPAIITEFKRRSPSRGIINDRVNICETVLEYEKAGASAVSVLTDQHFGGMNEDVEILSGKLKIPILRKDFMVDEIQVYEAKRMGSSAILLIAAALEKDKLEFMYNTARELDLDVLIEIHNEDELLKIPGNAEIVGINNRNLKDFKVNIKHSINLAGRLPDNVIKVAESGIEDSETLFEMYNRGFKAFLIGSRFMESSNPGLSAADFISEIRQTIK